MVEKEQHFTLHVSHQVQAAALIRHAVTVSEADGLHRDHLYHLVPAQRDIKGGKLWRSVGQVVHDD